MNTILTILLVANIILTLLFFVMTLVLQKATISNIVQEYEQINKQHLKDLDEIDQNICNCKSDNESQCCSKDNT